MIYDLYDRCDRAGGEYIHENMIGCSGVPHAHSKFIAPWYHDQIGLVQGREFQSNAMCETGRFQTHYFFHAGLEYAMTSRWETGSFVFNIVDLIVATMMICSKTRLMRMT